MHLQYDLQVLLFPARRYPRRLAGQRYRDFQQGTPLQTGNNGTAAKKTGSNEARLNSWFDQSVFSQAGNFTFGNTSRTSPDLRGFGTRSVDASLFKRFYFREKANVEFRAEAFNLRITPSRR